MIMMNEKHNAEKPTKPKFVLFLPFPLVSSHDRTPAQCRKKTNSKTKRL